MNGILLGLGQLVNPMALAALLGGVVIGLIVGSLPGLNEMCIRDRYKACLACGTCTFICPTCQCYDIRDYNTGNGIQRFRCWDSCMYSDFTLMAHGNIRNSQKERFRQRFMHKLVYFPENNDGMFSCVGCGRCVSKCPSSLNIVKVIKSLGVSEDV